MWILVEETKIYLFCLFVCFCWLLWIGGWLLQTMVQLPWGVFLFVSSSTDHIISSKNWRRTFCCSFACLLAHTCLFGSVSLSHIARTRMILMIPWQLRLSPSLDSAFIRYVYLPRMMLWFSLCLIFLLGLFCCRKSQYSNNFYLSQWFPAWDVVFLIIS